MKALLQRVTQAEVVVSGECVGRIERGLLVFVGLDRDDDRAVAERMVDKVLAYRVFGDEQGRMNRSVADVDGGVLLVSQFTLSAATGKGLRPSFSSAMAPEAAEQLYEHMLRYLQGVHPQVAAGSFGADMQVRLVNDGPVTFLLESRGD